MPQFPQARGITELIHGKGIIKANLVLADCIREFRLCDQPFTILGLSHGTISDKFCIALFCRKKRNICSAWWGTDKDLPTVQVLQDLPSEMLVGDV